MSAVECTAKQCPIKHQIDALDAPSPISRICKSNYYIVEPSSKFSKMKVNLNDEFKIE